MGKHGQSLREKLDKKTTDFISQTYFGRGDKLFLCSDGIADNLSNSDISNFVHTFRDGRECLKNIVNAIYEIENKKIKSKTNNPPERLKNNTNFKPILKGSGDNISGVIIENEGNERE